MVTLLVALAPLLAAALLVTAHAAAGRVARFDERNARLDSLFKAGQYADGEREAQALVDDARRTPGPDSLDLAQAYRWLAQGNFYNWHMNDAIDEYQRSIGIIERQRGTGDSLLITPLYWLSLTFQNSGRLASADSLAQRVVALATRYPGPDSVNLATPLNAMGWLHVDASAFSAAIHDFHRMIAILEHAAGDHCRPLGSGYHGLGVAMRRAGEYADAEDAYRRALEIRERCLPPDHPDIAWTLNNYANLRYDLGDVEGAAELHRRALEIREKRFGEWHGDVAYSLMNLGNCYELLGRFDEALPLERRALAIREKNLGPDHPDVASALNNLALVLEDLRHPAEAESLYRRCIAIREKRFGAGAPDVGRALDRLAHLRQGLGDERGAESLYVRTLHQRERAYGVGHPETEVTRVFLSQCVLRQGRASEAFELAYQAESLSVDHFRRTARALEERDALSLFGTRTRGLDDAVLAALAGGGGPDATTRVWDALVRARALVLDEMAERQRSLNATEDPAGRAALDTLTAVRSRLAALVLDGPDSRDDAGYPARLERARIDERAAEDRALAASAAFRTRASVAAAGIAAVRAALPAHTALIAYLRCDSVVMGARAVSGVARVYVGLVLPADGGLPKLVRLGEATEVETLVERWLARVAHPPAPAGRADAERACRVAGARLRAEVWDPLFRWVGAPERVLVVPDAALDVVNFAALPAADGHYLLERAPVLTLLSAERDVVAYDGRRRGGRGLLAIGAPAFDAAPAAWAPATTRGAAASGVPGGCQDEPPQFAPLPGTRAEVAAIGRLWRAHAPADSLGAATLCLDAVASKEAFERLAPGRRVLHVATHTFQLRPPCARGAAALHGERGLGMASQIAQQNPLLRTGIALAGAGRAATRDRGLLTAAEIAGLDLGSVEWAVLSACESGRGEIVGQEGVLGLERAFQEAGVACLITSLWEVDDSATTRWMNALYQARFTRHRGTAEAVQDAERTVLRERRAAGESDHPYYWAAFVATGDWR